METWGVIGRSNDIQLINVCTNFELEFRGHDTLFQQINTAVKP